jgi:hypothetical protein
MKKLTRNAIILLLVLIENSFVFSQVATNGLELRKPLSADSLSSFINIDKIILYRDPLEIVNYELADSLFVPEWFPAYSAAHINRYFNFSAKKAVNYFSINSNITLPNLERGYNQYLLDGGLNTILKKYPYNAHLYIYNEIWFTHQKTGIKYVVIHGTQSDLSLKNIKLSEPNGNKNKTTDKIDTIRIKDKTITRTSYKGTNIKSRLFFVNENDTIKWPNQMLTNDNLFEKKYTINSDLSNFKDMLYRSTVYIQSEIENGKRIFKTMVRGNEGHKMKSKSYKP